MRKVKVIVEYEVLVEAKDNDEAEDEANSIIEEIIDPYGSSQYIGTITYVRIIE